MRKHIKSCKRCRAIIDNKYSERHKKRCMMPSIMDGYCFKHSLLNKRPEDIREEIINIRDERRELIKELSQRIAQKYGLKKLVLKEVVR